MKILFYKQYPSDIIQLTVGKRAERHSVRVAEVSDSLIVGVKFNISAGIKGIFK